MINAQIRLQIINNGVWNGNPDDLWQFELNLQNGSIERVVLYAELKNDAGEVLIQAKSQDLNLSPGKKIFSIGEIRTMSFDLLTQDKKKLNGTRVLCLSLIRKLDGQLLANHCGTRVVLIQEDELNETEKSKVKFSGSSRLIGQYSNRISFFQEQDPSYLNWEINPQLSIHGIPLQGRIFLSTQANGFRYDINTASLHFDIHRFKDLLYEKALQKLEGERRILNKGGIGKTELLDYIGNYTDSIRKKFINKYSEKSYENLLARYKKIKEKGIGKRKNRRDSFYQRNQKCGQILARMAKGK